MAPQHREPPVPLHHVRPEDIATDRTACRFCNERLRWGSKWTDDADEWARSVVNCVELSEPLGARS